MLNKIFRLRTKGINYIYEKVSNLKKTQKNLQKINLLPLVIYRMSEAGYPKVKPNYVNNKNCLKNAVECFPLTDSDWIIIADNLYDETLTMINDLFPSISICKVSVGNGAGTFRIGYELALKYENDRIIYFLENDYIHRKGSLDILREGFELGKAEYITLYDHPDKYDYKNSMIRGGERTRVFLSSSVHWKITTSTTMTFAAKVNTLRKDKDIFYRWTNGTHPYDFEIFSDLRRRGRVLISPIPSYSTHGEVAYLAPLIDWERECGIII